MALAFPGWGFSLSFLVWIGFVPLFYALANQPRPRPFLTGFVAGLFYFLIVFRWFWSIYPLDTFGIQDKFASLVIVFLIYVISSAGMAVFWGFFGMAYGYWSRLREPSGNSRWLKVMATLIPAALFVLLEYARSYGFGLLWAGSGTLFGPHWTMGNLAYALAGNSLVLQLAAYVGIYGISFIVVLVNFLLFSILNGSKTRLLNNPSYDGLFNKGIKGMAIAAIIVLALAFAPVFFKPAGRDTSKKLNFAIIQTNQPTKISPTPKETLDAFKEQLDLLNRIAKEHPESQLIIFPETSDFFKNLSLFLTGSQIPNYFANLFKEPRLIIAGTRTIDTNDRAYSRIFALDTRKDIIGFYDKRLLMPGGEFLSYPMKFIVNILSKTKVSEFGGIRELGVGDKKISTVNFRGQFSVASLVCSELLSPGLARQTTRGSDIIVGMASYGVFHGNSALIKQNLAVARFRAAENQKPLLAASNMGLSYAIDSGGNVQFITQNQGAQILTGSIALNPQKSWYNKVGDIPVLVGSLVLVAVFSLQLIVHNRRNKVF